MEGRKDSGDADQIAHYFFNRLGVVQASSLTLPFASMAKKMGYRELIDYDKAGVIEIMVAIAMVLSQTNQRREHVDYAQSHDCTGKR